MTTTVPALADADARPSGPAAVREALIKATIDLIVDRGLSISVREIAAAAGVNHGLVHTYFGSKDALLQAAFDDLNQRAANERDDQGFPPPDLADRRGGELAKALARVMLDAPGNPFSSHPIAQSWREAFAVTRPDLADEERTERVIAASSLALGWALFADHLCMVHQLDTEQRDSVSQRITALVGEIGGIPA